MSSDIPLYERDPAAWRAHLAEGNRIQPRKRVSADVLFRDDGGRILLVDPQYKPAWDLPGGMVEANEPPLTAAIREVAEELGLEYAGGDLLVVDWVAPHEPWDDLLAFIFDGGVLSADQQRSIRLEDGELNAARFCTVPEARTLLRPYVSRRVDQALDAFATGRTHYLHDGCRS
ncbi:NUDIX domain-containing protein [Dactylosporangium sp. NPDC000521]|uniref:NUDIX domain-containing protein n=1 Tax=Dactylosporangium sp. NPDC000521 TaxID=3363975 RepID=UPI0036C1BD2E